MKDLSRFKFFIKPCFVCSRMSWEMGEGEYGTGGSYAICDADDDIYEKWQEDKEGFPNCESPKRCTRKNIFQFNTNFDYVHEYDYFNILSTMSNPCEEHQTAVSIAHGLANFNARLRQFKTN